MSHTYSCNLKNYYSCNLIAPVHLVTFDEMLHLKLCASGNSDLITISDKLEPGIEILWKLLTFTFYVMDSFHLHCNGDPSLWVTLCHWTSMAESEWSSTIHTKLPVCSLSHSLLWSLAPKGVWRKKGWKLLKKNPKDTKNNVEDMHCLLGNF